MFFEYTGKREGKQLVHTRIVTKAAFEIEGVYHREVEEGFSLVKKMIPNAVRRLGCFCCYPDGPDLDSTQEIDKQTGNAVLKYFVNFDFEKPENNNEE